MRITLEEVRRITTLARVRTDAATRERLRSSLDQILDYVEKLNEVDTENVPPAPGVMKEPLPARDDRPGDCLGVEEALSNAPESGHGCFKVPRVLPG